MIRCRNLKIGHPAAHISRHALLEQLIDQVRRSLNIVQVIDNDFGVEEKSHWVLCRPAQTVLLPLGLDLCEHLFYIQPS